MLSAVITEATLTKLRALVDAMDTAVANESSDYPDLNVRFHTAAFEQCPYPTLRSMAESELQRSSRLRTVRFVPGYLPESQIEHRALLAGLEHRDAQTAEAITRQPTASRFPFRRPRPLD